jgi:hypothetical protein
MEKVMSHVIYEKSHRRPASVLTKEVILMVSLKKFQIQAKMGEKFTIESTLGNHVVYVDQAQAAGGDDKGPTPLELLFL